MRGTLRNTSSTAPNVNRATRPKACSNQPDINPNDVPMPTEITEIKSVRPAASVRNHRSEGCRSEKIDTPESIALSSILKESLR